MDCFERSLLRHIVVKEQTDLYDYLVWGLFPHIKDEYDQDYSVFTIPGIYTISDEQVINDYIESLKMSEENKIISDYGIDDALELYKDIFHIKDTYHPVDEFPTVAKLVYIILDKKLNELEPDDLLQYYKEWENDMF